MKNLKPFIASSLMLMTIMSMPLVSFADNNKDKGEKNRGVKIENRNEIESEKGDDSRSAWSKLTGFFGNKNVNTNLAVSTTIPNISGITAPTVLKVGETGTWSVKATDPQNGSLSYAVIWGDETSNPTARMAPSFVQTSTFSHTYANAGKYNITFTVSNSAGEKATSSTTVHVGGASVTQAPVISNLTAVSNNPRHATITWTTDIRSNSVIWYSTTSPVNTSIDPKVIGHNKKVLNHRINLNKLQPGTKYYVIVGSENGAGKTLSSETSFTTAGLSDNSTPVITSVTGNTEITAGDTATLTVNAYDPKNGTLSYSADWGDSVPSMLSRSFWSGQPFVQTSTFTHVYSAPGTYTATFTTENSAGKKATSKITISVKPQNPVDTTAPVISNIGIQVGNTTSTISWTTNELATGKVFYSTVTPVDVNTATSVSDANLVASHSLNITGLSANTLYHFIVVSSDGSSNKTTSSEGTFTTTAL